jgi:competence protein ComEC
MHKKLALIIIVFFLFGDFLLWREIFLLDQGKVIFFNVGQGDAILIKTKEHHYILIDGGPQGKLLLKKLSQELPFWNKKIDLIFLTHPERDHLEGLLSVLDNYKVENIIWTGIKRNTEIYKVFEEKIKKENAKIYFAKANLKVIAGSNIFLVLYPFESLKDLNFEKSCNETSLVLELFSENKKFLFTGDISQKEEEKIYTKYAPQKIDVLKVAHHGSKYSTSKEFLENFFPEFAVISCGKNNYGLPSQEVLNLLSFYGIKILRTDINGDLKFNLN